MPLFSSSLCQFPCSYVLFIPPFFSLFLPSFITDRCLSHSLSVILFFSPFYIRSSLLINILSFFLFLVSFSFLRLFSTPLFPILLPIPIFSFPFLPFPLSSLSLFSFNFSPFLSQIFSFFPLFISYSVHSFDKCLIRSFSLLFPPFPMLYPSLSFPPSLSLRGSPPPTETHRGMGCLVTPRLYLYSAVGVREGLPNAALRFISRVCRLF